VSIRDLYLAKRGSAADAMREVRDGDFIIVPTGVGEPPTLLEALSEQRRDFHDVKVAQILAMRKFAYIDPTTADHVRHVAFFYGAATRAGGQEGWIDFIPNCFSKSRATSNAGRFLPTSYSAWRRRWTPTAISPSAWAPTTPWPPSPGPARWCSR
jgi:acyl-CoA hydrolase